MQRLVGRTTKTDVSAHTRMIVLSPSAEMTPNKQQKVNTFTSKANNKKAVLPCAAAAAAAVPPPPPPPPCSCARRHRPPQPPLGASGPPRGRYLAPQAPRGRPADACCCCPQTADPGSFPIASLLPPEPSLGCLKKRRAWHAVDAEGETRHKGKGEGDGHEEAWGRGGGGNIELSFCL